MSPATLQTVRLSRGKHSSPDHGACVMELASMLAGEPFTDRPRSVSPVIASYLRSLNDLAGVRRRQLLYPYAAVAVGTRHDGLEVARFERCRAALEEVHAGAPLLRRFVARFVPNGPCAPGTALEHFTAYLLRRLRARGGDWHLRALALADELIAMTADPSVATDQALRVRSPAAATACDADGEGAGVAGAA
jgi:hypothetical protein